MTTLQFVRHCRYYTKNPAKLIREQQQLKKTIQWDEDEDEDYQMRGLVCWEQKTRTKHMA